MISSRSGSFKGALKSGILHIFVDGVAIAGVILIFFVVNSIVKQLQVADWLSGVLGHAEKIGLMACLTLFSLKAITEIVLEVYGSIKVGLSSAWSQTKRFKWTAANEAFSYAVGILGFTVVYGLMHRAGGVDNVVAKTMIYIAAFILAGEVIYMVADTVKDRVVLAAETRQAMPQ